MAKRFLQILILFLFYGLTHPTDEHVIQLYDANFEKHVSTKEYILIMFFLPWSGLCQKFRPHFAKAARIVKRNDIPAHLGKVDCSNKGRVICETKLIGHQFPTLHFYKKGQFVKEYKGARDANSIVKFIRVQISPNMMELKTVDEFKEFLKRQNEVVVIGFFEEETKLQTMFFKVFEEMKEMINFAYTTSEKVLLKEGVFNGIVLFRPPSLINKYEEERILFPGRVVIGEIKNFIIINYHGLVGQRNSVNSKDFYNPLIVLYYTVDYHSDDKEPNYWKSRMLKIAYKYKDYVTFAISAKDDFEEELAPFNIDYNNPMKPFVLGMDLEHKKYVMTDEFSAETFEKFVDDFVNRRIPPFVKSKPIPQEDDGFVVIAVAKNFNQVVIDNDKDILISMYIPWSGRYQKFLPTMRQLADLLQNEDVDVVKMDITENEIPEIFLNKSLPNLYWIPSKNKKNPILYQGSRSVDDMVKFIAKNARKELHHYNRNGLPKQNVKEEL